MGGAGFPPCWLSGLRRPKTGEYLFSLVGLMADSGRAHAKEYFPELLLPVSLSSGWATATTAASAGDPPTLAGRSGSVSYRVTALCPGSWCTHYFVCALQEWSLCFLQSCRSLGFPRLGFKVWFSGIPPPIARPPGWEAWRGAQNLHSSVWTSVV